MDKLQRLGFSRNNEAVNSISSCAIRSTTERSWRSKPDSDGPDVHTRVWHGPGGAKPFVTEDDNFRAKQAWERRMRCKEATLKPFVGTLRVESPSGSA